MAPVTTDCSTGAVPIQSAGPTAPRRRRMRAPPHRRNSAPRSSSRSPPRPRCTRIRRQLSRAQVRLHPALPPATSFPWDSVLRIVHSLRGRSCKWAFFEGPLIQVRLCAGAFLASRCGWAFSFSWFHEWVLLIQFNLGGRCRLQALLPPPHLDNLMKYNFGIVSFWI